MPDQEPASLSDESLAVASREGDLSAFEEIVKRHEASVFRFLTSKTANRTDAEDLTQQVFLRAYRKLHLYKSQYRFLPWLYTIARRESIDHYRKSKPEVALDNELIDEQLPSDHLEQSDQHQIIWQSIRDLLPETTATAFWLRYEEDLSLAEIAKVLNLTQVHVRVLLHRGRVKLAKELKHTTLYGEIGTFKSHA